MLWQRARRIDVSILLKDGSFTEDRRLDRLVHYDEKSLEFPIRTQLPERKKPRSYSWRMLGDVLDQGREGACVGFSVTHELMARPAEVDPPGSDSQFAREQIYWPAQRIDPWPGGAYPGASPFYEGTSVLAGVKVAHRLGYFDEYRWAFGLEDLVLGVGRHGPALLGLWWHGGMFRPDPNGFITPTGGKFGGHAILCVAVKIVWKPGSKRETLDDVDFDQSYVVLLNSWGMDWGYRGLCKVRLRDMRTLLLDQGEAVFMVRRTIHPAAA